MTAINQDFTIFAGDDHAVTFTVTDDTGAPVDISTASEITWQCARQPRDAALLAKSKTGGQITFVTDGRDGAFNVAISHTDTPAFYGFYAHLAVVIDVEGNRSTVAEGRMEVAP